jgi:hypothetical protein
MAFTVAGEVRNLANASAAFGSLAWLDTAAEMTLDL